MSGPRTGQRSYGGYATRVLEVEGAGPRLVLVHGFGDSALTWSGVLDELAVAGRSAIAVDLPGFGEAEPQRPGPMLPQLDKFLADVVVEQAERGAVLLVGNSLGGCASVRAVEQGLPVAGAVVLADPALAQFWLAQKFRAERDSWLTLLLTRRLPVPKPVFNRAAAVILRRLVYADPAKADPGVIARFVDYFDAQGGQAWITRTVRALAPELGACYDFAKITAPLLVVHGERDRIVPVGTSVRLHRGVAGSKLVIRPDWGHCPQHDDPAELTRMVLEFADSIPA